MQQPLIAHILFRLDYGGLENGLVNLLNGLPGGRYRHAVICLTDFTDFRQRITRPDVAVYALNKQPGKDLGAYWRLYRLLRSLRPELVHTRNAGVLDCAVVAALAGVRVRIHSYHGWDVDDLHGKNIRGRRLRRWLHPLIWRFIALSQDIEQWLQLDESIAPKRITQIYNGVDTQKFKPQASAASLGADHGLIIGTVGRLQAVKNQALLVSAVALLSERYPDMRHRLQVRIMGDGALRDELEQQIRAAELNDVIHVVGFRDDVPEQLRSINLFVLPSLNEGVSNTVLEAMASALPVIATRVGGNVELVEEAVTGFLVAPNDSGAMADAILCYLREPQLLASHGQAARRLAEQRFSLAVMLADYDRLYRQALGGGVN